MVYLNQVEKIRRWESAPPSTTLSTQHIIILHVSPNMLFIELLWMTRFRPAPNSSAVKKCVFPCYRGMLKWWKQGDFPAFASGSPEVGGVGISNDWCIMARKFKVLSKL